MFTMTAREIKQVLRRNRMRGFRPSSQTEIARAMGVSRSLICMAIKTPFRYPAVRRGIEALVAPERAKKAS